MQLPNHLLLSKYSVTDMAEAKKKPGRAAGTVTRVPVEADIQHLLDWIKLRDQPRPLNDRTLKKAKVPSVPANVREHAKSMFPEKDADSKAQVRAFRGKAFLPIAPMSEALQILQCGSE